MWVLESPEGTFRLTPGAVKTVGRTPRADFILDAALVSRLHCRLTAAADWSGVTTTGWDVMAVSTPVHSRWPKCA